MRLRETRAASFSPALPMPWPALAKEAGVPFLMATATSFQSGLQGGTITPAQAVSGALPIEAEITGFHHDVAQSLQIVLEEILHQVEVPL